MKGMKPGGRERPSRMAGSGRTCAKPGCSTKLSTYNQKEFCWLHTEIAFPNYRGRRLVRGET
jgi:hypothetical protein